MRKTTRAVSLEAFIRSANEGFAKDDAKAWKMDAARRRRRKMEKKKGVKK